MNKKIRNGLIIALVLLVAISIGGSFFMIDFALRPANENQNPEKDMAQMCEEYPEMRTWLDSLRQCQALRDTIITAADGTRLFAYYARAPHPANGTAVIIHGYRGNSISMFHLGYMYHKSLGFNILLPDLRYCGFSEGEAVQMGWLDRKDVIQWMGMVPSVFGEGSEVVLHGVSMGAATTMMTSGEQLPQFVRCFVEDCGYTSVWDQFKKELREDFHLPAFPILYLSNWLCGQVLDWNFKEASAVKQVARCQLPMLFIHGDSDKYVPTWMVHKVFAAKPEPKELWITANTAHTMSYPNYPSEYTERVRKFVGKYIRGNKAEIPKVIRKN